MSAWAGERVNDLPKPLFLERQSYRRRRIIDAWLVLPIFGAFLFLIPLLWEEHAVRDQPILAEKGLYIFAVWFGLVALSAILSRLLGVGGQLKNLDHPQDSSSDPGATDS